MLVYLTLARRVSSGSSGPPLLALETWRCEWKRQLPYISINLSTSLHALGTPPRRAFLIAFSVAWSRA